MSFEGNKPKYYINGKGPFGPGRIVLKTIHLYVDKHKETATIDSIKQAFQRPNGFELVETLDKANKINDKVYESGKKHKRYFTKETEVLTLSDNTIIAVCNNWANDDTFKKFRESVKTNFSDCTISETSV